MTAWQQEYERCREEWHDAERAVKSWGRVPGRHEYRPIEEMTKGDWLTATSRLAKAKKSWLAIRKEWTPEKAFE